MSYSVGQVAKLAGISVRTLHHYDEIGLLMPSERTAAGYRRYNDAEVERLRQILEYRELGFDLARIKRILDDPAGDPIDQLQRKRAELHAEVGRLERTLRRVDSMIKPEAETAAGQHVRRKSRLVRSAGLVVVALGVVMGVVNVAVAPGLTFEAILAGFAEAIITTLLGLLVVLPVFLFRLRKVRSRA